VTKEAAAAVILLKNRVLMGSHGGKRNRIENVIHMIDVPI
jgi:hypothetical protein